MSKHVLLLFFVTLSHWVKADLEPVFLSIQLTAPKATYQNGEVIPFNLEFQNKDVGKRPVLLPGNQKSGSKIVFFSFFSVKDDFYTEVYREEIEIKMDTTNKGWTDFRYLKSGERFSFPVFFNDGKNYSSHIEAHHRLPNLPFGEYEVLAWYQPWTNDLAQYAFNPISDFKAERKIGDTTRFNMPMVGTQSNYFKITISDVFQAPAPFLVSRDCPTNCNFCEAIEKENWNEVERQIRRQTYYIGEDSRRGLDSNWRMIHRNVAWLGPEPQAILSSLPTYTSRSMIFKNTKGYHYYNLTWQLGIVYPGRSRMGTIFHWIGLRQSPIKSSEVDYCELIYFKPF